MNFLILFFYQRSCSWKKYFYSTYNSGNNLSSISRYLSYSAKLRHLWYWTNILKISKLSSTVEDKTWRLNNNYLIDTHTNAKLLTLINMRHCKLSQNRLSKKFCLQNWLCTAIKYYNIQLEYSQLITSAWKFSDLIFE